MMHSGSGMQCKYDSRQNLNENSELIQLVIEQKNVY